LFDRDRLRNEKLLNFYEKGGDLDKIEAVSIWGVFTVNPGVVYIRGML